MYALTMVNFGGTVHFSLVSVQVASRFFIEFQILLIVCESECDVYFVCEIINDDAAAGDDKSKKVN